MSEELYPKEVNDFPTKRDFYAESLKADKPIETDKYLPDPSEETGSAADLGGGYNSPGEGQITPPPAENPYWPSQEQRDTGLEGIRQARETLEEIKNPKTTDEDPS